MISICKTCEREWACTELDAMFCRKYAVFMGIDNGPLDEELFEILEEVVPMWEKDGEKQFDDID